MKYKKINKEKWNEFLNCVKDDICLDVKEGTYKGQTIVWYEKLYDIETIVLGTQQYAKYFIKEETK